MTLETIPQTHLRTYREVLTGNRTYYVRTDGSDSNTGLANTAGGAFLTIQKAVNTIAGLDINAKTVTVQVGDGTYTGAVVLKNVVGYSAPGDLVIQGNSGTPTNVVISPSSGVHAITYADSPAIWDIKDMKLSTSGAGYCLHITNSKIRISGIDFTAGVSGIHLYTITYGKIEVIGNYTISGGAAYHYYAEIGGEIFIVAKTVTISNSPTFGYFAVAAQLGLCVLVVVTYTNGGTVTATQYGISGNSILDIRGATVVPGNVAGATGTGGQVIT